MPRGDDPTRIVWMTALPDSSTRVTVPSVVFAAPIGRSGTAMPSGSAPTWTAASSVPDASSRATLSGTSVTAADADGVPGDASADDDADEAIDDEGPTGDDDG